MNSTLLVFSIVSYPETLLIYRSIIMESKRIIYVDMVADLFHPGHVNFFRQIKSLYPDSELVVGLMSDVDATQYKRKPILNIDERVNMLEACKYVRRVIPNAPMPVTTDFIEKNGINLVIHGNDISEKDREYWYGDAILLEKYQEIGYTEGISTTQIIKRITGDRQQN